MRVTIFPDYYSFLDIQFVLPGDDDRATAHAGALTHPQGAHPPGFHQPHAHPSAGQRQPQQQQRQPQHQQRQAQQQQRQQGNAKAGKMWVLDGRIYNYK